MARRRAVTLLAVQDLQWLVKGQIALDPALLSRAEQN
jgi:hypothetical protein